MKYSISEILDTRTLNSSRLDMIEKYVKESDSYVYGVVLEKDNTLSMVIPFSKNYDHVVRCFEDYEVDNERV